MAANGTPVAKSPYERRVGFLEFDPENLGLIVETAQSALDENRFDEADQLLDRYEDLQPLTPGLINLRGLIALRRGDHQDAGQIFQSLIDKGIDDPSLRFNRAWIFALDGQFEDALALLDEVVTKSVPAAATLKVRALHHLGRLEDALKIGQEFASQDPVDDGLLGALSVVAMDAGDIALARSFAEEATSGSDALTTNGLLALDANDPERSLKLFDAALNENPGAPRAWLGRGLGLLSLGKLPEATEALARGAEGFADHLRSWIAVGWAQFLARDLAAARRTFEHALSIDDTFAESHGGLAVIDVAEGHLDRASRGIAIAMRLDRRCFGGLLAQALLEQARGNSDAARRLWDVGLNLPVGVDGKTIAQAMIGMQRSSKGDKEQS